MKRNLVLTAAIVSCVFSPELLSAQESVFIEETSRSSSVTVIHEEDVKEDAVPSGSEKTGIPAAEIPDTDSGNSVYIDDEPALNEKAEEKSESSDEPAQKKTVSSRRPKKPDSSQIESSASKTESKGSTYVKDCTDTLNYGLESEISDLIDEFIKNEDMRFVDPIYDLFQSTKNPAVRNKILKYFTKLKDPCLSDFAVDVINDPYDEKKETVDLCFDYVMEVECHEAVGGLVDLVEKEEPEYFNGALRALAELGSNKEAKFLASYLERDDLTAAQRQSLMRALGKMKAIETWDTLSEIVQDNDENSFVRMYAAEALGAMGKTEGEDILIKLFETDDANLRVYVVKGISFFEGKKSDDVILQALKDSQYKVRLEAVASIKKRTMRQAVPSLVYRCKHKDEEKAVKEKCYDAIAYLNTREGNEYLVSILKDRKIADATKAKVSQYLLEYNHAGTDEIIELARSSLKDDKLKNLRYSLGKEFAKYGRSEFAEICGEYIASEDVATQGTGLDIWAKGRYSSLKSVVRELARGAEEENEADSPASRNDPKSKTARPKKPNANAKKAKRILEIGE